MTSAWMRITDLAEKARGAGRTELAQGYDHAAKIVEEIGLAAEAGGDTAESIPLEAARSFCGRHCFMGRKDGPGKADDCSICPLAPFTLGVIDDDELDEGEVERQRAARVKREAATIKGKLDEMGSDTLAAESHLERAGPGNLQPADG